MRFIYWQKPATDAFVKEYNSDFSQDLLKLTIIELKMAILSEEHVNNLQAIWRHTKSPFVFWTWQMTQANHPVFEFVCSFFKNELGNKIRFLQIKATVVTFTIYLAFTKYLFQFFMFLFFIITLWTALSMLPLLFLLFLFLSFSFPDASDTEHFTYSVINVKPKFKGRV